MNEAMDRMQAFKDGFLDLCRKHKVMLEFDDDEFRFVEQGRTDDGYKFIIDVSDMEEEVRLELWDEFHGQA